MASQAGKHEQPTAAPPAALSVLFILLWSTGFITARAQAPFDEPLTFVFARFALTAVLFAGAVAWKRGTILIGWRAVGHNLVAGMLLHGIYLGCVFFAVTSGMPAGIAALIQSTAPIFTAVLAGPLLGERVAIRQWMGLAISLFGVTLTLSPKLGAAGFTLVPITVSLVGLTALIAGGFYQRMFVAKDRMTVANFYQYIGGALIVMPFMLVLEPLRLVTHPVYLASLAWAVVVLSFGAFSLYIYFLRTGAVTKAASLMFLVPAVTSVIAWALFGEVLTPVQILGGVVTLAGVAFAQRS
ncbi:MAG: DMT family transporter [Tepidamorphaceae bacterium]|nr:DMT family transporter [Rhodobiaceae bacterium]MCC0049090.1 DMT family transporter [Rhodobiaceae bacterium]